MLAILTVVYALNFLDRTIFNVLIEPIKKEFALSDTTMGLLAGFGFALFPLLVSPIGLTGATQWHWLLRASTRPEPTALASRSKPKH